MTVLNISIPASMGIVNNQVSRPALRDYQQAACTHVHATTARGQQSIVLSLLTGTGKSVVLGSLAADFLPYRRVLYG